MAPTARPPKPINILIAVSFFIDVSFLVGPEPSGQVKSERGFAARRADYAADHAKATSSLWRRVPVLANSACRCERTVVIEMPSSSAI